MIRKYFGWRKQHRAALRRGTSSVNQDAFALHCGHDCSLSYEGHGGEMSQQFDGVSVRVAVCAVGFTSHRQWAEGLARSSRHAVSLHITAPDRWKWRMQCGAVEFTDAAASAEVVLVDGILDVSALAAELRRQAPAPKVVVYMHENQLTTPFVSSDRDVRNNTHWHYGAANYRTLTAADAVLFNSATHLQQFAEALPAFIKQQCPKDTVQAHLDRAATLLETRCAIVPIGLDFDGLEDSRPRPASGPGQQPSTVNQGEGEEVAADVSGEKDHGANGATVGASADRPRPTAPTILWNARLEEDKDPGTFLSVLRELGTAGVAFSLVVLGEDPTKGKTWHAQFRAEFGQQLLFCGFCESRAEYGRWLAASDVFVSTARHETFGVALLEACRCGVIPVVPERLSYPEILSSAGLTPEDSADLIYTDTSDCRAKLVALLGKVAARAPTLPPLRLALGRIAALYAWDRVGPIYDRVLGAVCDGASAVEAVEAADGATTSAASTATSNGVVFPGGSAANATGDLAHCGGPDELSLRVQWLTDAADPAVAQYRPKSLRNHKVYHLQRAEHALVGERPAVHGGRRAVARMLQARALGRPIRPLSFLCTEDLLQAVLLSGGHQTAHPGTLTLEGNPDALTLEGVGSDPPAAPAITVHTATKELLEEVRGQKLNTGDSIFALLSFPVSVAMEQVVAHPPVLILENVRNAENIGSVLRTAYCLGITSVVASTAAWSALRDTRSARTSMGTIYFHQLHLAPDLPAALNALRQGGIKLYAAEIGPGATPVHPHGPDRSWGLVLGNEDSGVTAETLECCDCMVEIPQASGDSLNVGHAAAIAMFQLGSQSPRPTHDGGGRWE